MSRKVLQRRHRQAMLGVVLGVGLAACSPKEQQAPAPAPSSEAPAPAAAAVGAAVATIGQVTVHDPVAHPPLPGQTTGVAFMVLRNGASEADRLLGVSSAVSSPVELHTHEMSDGMMKMRKVDAIDLPAGGEVVLTHSGYHIMLFNFAPTGNEARLKLRFEKAGEVEVAVPVRERGDAAH